MPVLTIYKKEDKKKCWFRRWVRYNISPILVLVLVITTLAGTEYNIALMLTLKGIINLHSKNDATVYSVLKYFWYPLK